MQRSIQQKIIRQHRSAFDNQRGGALLVAMVMIFMLSIMGISSMRGSTLEKRMATNAVETSTTFQTAESSSEIALNTPGNLQAAWMNGNAGITADTDLQQSFGMNSDYTLQFVANGPADNYSMGVGSGSNFMSLRYVAEGRATIDGFSARYSVEQGAYRIVPSP